MNNIIFKAIKKISNKEFSIKNNYKLIRQLQKIMNMPNIGVKYEDIVFELEERYIKARVFNPKNKVNGLIIYIHGGGWSTGSIESYSKLCSEISNKTNRIVLSIDYRLAPEYPYPNGLNDCYDVVKIIMTNLRKFNLKNDDVCLMGDSAGGNLVAAVSIKSKMKKEFKISKQILIYPVLQTNHSNNSEYKSVIEKGKDFLLTQKQLKEYVSLYVKNEKDLNNPLVSPLKVKFPFMQPKTLIITADHDPLKDEGKAYADKLKLYLNHVEYHNIKNSMHGFLASPLGKKHKEITFKKIIEFLGDKDEKNK